MVTGYNKQNSIEWPPTVFSHTSGRVAESVLKRQIVSLPVTTWSCVSVWVCCYKMSQPSKRRNFLQSSEIAELFLDTDSGDTIVSSASSVEGGPEGVPGVSHTQPYRQTAGSPESSSSISSSASDEDEAIESVPGEQTQHAVTLQWTFPSCPRSSVAHTYTGAPEERRTMKRPT